MKRHLRAYLAKTLAYVNAFPTRLTHKADLLSLLSKLHPVSTDKRLIRLGPNGDGGYLLPDDLNGIDACFSPGVNNVSGFEKECADRGIKVFLADKSVDKPADEHELFKFTKKFVGAIANEDFMTLDEWVDDSLPEKESDLLLQIDIEGYEYEVFLATSKKLMARFRIIIVEFHNLDKLWSEPFFNFASRTFEKILQTHACVHIHPNNHCGLVKRDGIEIPVVMEFTFLRNDRIENMEYQTEFPNPLDYNNLGDNDLPLPKCWYRAK